MWYTWLTLLLVSCALVRGEVEGGAGPVTEGTAQVTDVTGPVSDTQGPAGEVIDILGNAAQPLSGQTDGAQNEAAVENKGGPINPVTDVQLPVATTRSPPRTLDRQGAELAWRSWLQSPESGNPNGPPRRITTKSLFITPLVCPKGQRLDRNGCIQTVTVNKDEHERILLDQLNALFINATPSNNADVIYDYGEDEPGPLQLTIPIGLEPQTHQNVDKKGDGIMLNDASIEAELELLKIQQQNGRMNDTSADTNILSHNVLSNLLTYSDKPKRDSPMLNTTETETKGTSDEGQKEEVFGNVNVDPVLYDTNVQNEEPTVSNEPKHDSILITDLTTNENSSKTNADTPLKSSASLTSKDAETIKLNPENDYSDIGEAIKLISRYAEVSTDDNFPKTDKFRNSDDGILGTRTKLQYRRNKPKPNPLKDHAPMLEMPGETKETRLSQTLRGRPDVYYRYPNDKMSPPENYPFKRLQDYWPGRNQIGGLYSNLHENPKRHHHSYPHYFRPRGYPTLGYSDTQSRLYPDFQRYPHKVHYASPIRSRANNQDIYSLLGLRHWFSNEGASKR